MHDVECRLTLEGSRMAQTEERSLSDPFRAWLFTLTSSLAKIGYASALT